VKPWETYFRTWHDRSYLPQLYRAIIVEDFLNFRPQLTFRSTDFSITFSDANNIQVLPFIVGERATNRMVAGSIPGGVRIFH
jgi:hypothetical protein